MSSNSKKILRGTIIALMLSAVPVASAVGQDIGQPAAQPTSAQALIHNAANGGTVGQPASMGPATVLPTASVQSPVQQAVAQTVVAAAAEEASALEAEVEELQNLDERAERLRPGQFIWQPERSERGPVELVVSIEQQMAFVYRGGELIGVSTVSTGRAGHRTPTGTYPILQKNRRHFSNLYNNAPMPNMQRLTWGGIALHAGALPGYPASHGCIRLPMEFSRLLFGVTSLGSRVHIIADTPPSANQALFFATGQTPPNRAAIRLASLRR
jgi:lipoprotein-anchoring transpeptidase ErfK/SrfK